MSKEQAKAYFESGKVLNDLSKMAKEAGYEVSADDLKGVTGGGFGLFPITVDKDGIMRVRDGNGGDFVIHHLGEENRIIAKPGEQSGIFFKPGEQSGVVCKPGEQDNLPYVN